MPKSDEVYNFKILYEFRNENGVERKEEEELLLHNATPSIHLNVLELCKFLLMIIIILIKNI